MLACPGPAAGQTDPLMEIGRGRIDLVFAAEPDEKLHKLVREWVQSCAHAEMERHRPAERDSQSDYKSGLKRQSALCA